MSAQSYVLDDEVIEMKNQMFMNGAIPFHGWRSVMEKCGCWWAKGKLNKKNQ
jgi:hypothetical protein